MLDNRLLTGGPPTLGSELNAHGCPRLGGDLSSLFWSSKRKLGDLKVETGNRRKFERQRAIDLFETLSTRAAGTPPGMGLSSTFNAHDCPRVGGDLSYRFLKRKPEDLKVETGNRRKFEVACHQSVDSTRAAQ